MRARCCYPRHKSYHLYGGAGITICDRWLHSFWAFVQDVGPRPSPKHTLDRRDGKRGYEPGNVRWATQQEQLRNQSRNRRLTLNGETYCLADWAERLGISRFAIRSRIVSLGWSVERALTTPVRPIHRRQGK